MLLNFFLFEIESVWQVRRVKLSLLVYPLCFVVVTVTNPEQEQNPEQEREKKEQGKSNGILVHSIFVLYYIRFFCLSY